MSREIRRVPANWQHPTKSCEHSPWKGGCEQANKNGGECFQPMHDCTFDERFEEWVAEYRLWKEGKHPDQKEYPYWEWAGGPPDPEYYRPDWKEGEATWYQIYEGVSEGTPISPPFETTGELVEWLATNKDYWGETWTREQAEAMLKRKHAPSMVILDGKIYNSQESLTL